MNKKQQLGIGANIHTSNNKDDKYGMIPTNEAAVSHALYNNVVTTPQTNEASIPSSLTQLADVATNVLQIFDPSIPNAPHDELTFPTPSSHTTDGGSTNCSSQVPTSPKPQHFTIPKKNADLIKSINIIPSMKSVTHDSSSSKPIPFSPSKDVTTRRTMSSLPTTNFYQTGFGSTVIPDVLRNPTRPLTPIRSGPQLVLLPKVRASAVSPAELPTSSAIALQNAVSPPITSAHSLPTPQHAFHPASDDYMLPLPPHEILAASGTAVRGRRGRGRGRGRGSRSSIVQSPQAFSPRALPDGSRGQFLTHAAEAAARTAIFDAPVVISSDEESDGEEHTSAPQPATADYSASTLCPVEQTSECSIGQPVSSLEGTASHIESIVYAKTEGESNEEWYVFCRVS